MLRNQAFDSRSFSIWTIGWYRLHQKNVHGLYRLVQKLYLIIVLRYQADALIAFSNFVANHLSSILSTNDGTVELIHCDFSLIRRLIHQSYRRRAAGVRPNYGIKTQLRNKPNSTASVDNVAE